MFGLSCSYIAHNMILQNFAWDPTIKLQKIEGKIKIRPY